jgi:apolipoprotein D and lipocalin family protein
MQALKLKSTITLYMVTVMLIGCLGVPEGIRVIDNFELNRYLGKWYEIARLDHPFERGMTQISAEYSLNEDGSVKVLNSGFKVETGVRDQAEGKAYFIDSPKQGSLKVSFFGPFYGSYNIIELDQQNYTYAMITGPDRDYLWILSRTPHMDQAILDQLVAQAKKLGFATEKLIYVNQDQTTSTP